MLNRSPRTEACTIGHQAVYVSKTVGRWVDLVDGVGRDNWEHAVTAQEPIESDEDVAHGALGHTRVASQPKETLVGIWRVWHTAVEERWRWGVLTMLRSG